MGSNRVAPASASMPTTLQTHTPSGLSSPMSPQIPVLDMTSSIKTEPMTHLDSATRAHCPSENWVESYQDLSSWCSATSASSPATCQLPVTDETLVSGFGFHGEIDFDLRKSEEIASFPLEEDCSFNLWGSEEALLGDSISPLPPVIAVPSTEKSNPVLLKDCWWSDTERGKSVKELETSRLQTLATAPSSAGKNHFGNETPSTIGAVKEEVIEIKENMNPVPVAVPQTFLSDPIKMAELQMRFERIASLTHPGVNSRTKAADLMKILQQQIAASYKKKYSSPAAVSDLHNYSKVPLGPGIPSTSTAETQLLTTQTVSNCAPAVTGNAENLFQSDPFDGLFPSSDSQMSQEPSVLTSGMTLPSAVPHQSLLQNVVVAPVFDSNTFNSIKPTIQTSSHRSSDLFSEAHHQIMRGSSKPQLLQNQPPVQHSNPQLQYPSSQPQTSSMTQAASASAPIYSPSLGSSSMKKENGLSIQMPLPRINMPELDINFEALLFGSAGGLTGGNKITATPEVLKPLVETPDPESFDLLSYLCDDKLNTPPVSLDNNPFHFPQPSTTNISSTLTTTVTEHKPNVMVVKPLAPIWPKTEVVEKGVKNESDSAVIIEVKPQVMPSVLAIEEEEEKFMVHNTGEPRAEEQISPRPSRSARKRKYSEDEFVLSPSPSDETPKSTRRRRSSSKYDSDEEFTLPVRKPRKKSVSTIFEEDDEDEDEDEEAVKPKRSRTTSSRRRGERTVSSCSSETDRYRELRDRNNEASRKSRLTRKAREQELGQQAEVLTKENMVLKVKVEEMENLVKKLREALLHSMMKKS